jgi:hypothetical protein
MATLAQKIQCEQDTREMLQQEELPPPDRVEYGHTCIRLFWEQSKVVLVVDIDAPPAGFEPVGESLDDLDLNDVDEDAEDVGQDDAVEELERLDRGDYDEGDEMD